MRSGMFLEAYSEDFDVTLLVLPVYSEGTIDRNFLDTHCKSTRFVSRQDRGHPSVMLDTSGRPFDVVHISRLELAPVLSHFASIELGSVPHAVLDIDDFESRRALRFASLHASQGDHAAAESQRRYGSALAELERTLLPLFHRLFMTHAMDVTELARAYGLATVREVPNAVRIPQSGPSLHCVVPATLTFVGSMDYWPNVDGVCWFCAEVLPLLRSCCKLPFHVLIAGPRPDKRVQALASADVSVLGYVQALDDLYARTTVAIAPLRAGAGTRIKILEAMSYGCPSVSTSVGIEGLAVANGGGVLVLDVDAVGERVPGEVAVTVMVPVVNWLEGFKASLRSAMSG